jgi:hypothetical protein
MNRKSKRSRQSLVVPAYHVTSPIRPPRYQIKPIHTAATATTADMPFKITLPIPRTAPALVGCVGFEALLVLLPDPSPVLVGVEKDADGDGYEMEEVGENTPPATMAGVIESVVVEAARA